MVNFISTSALILPIVLISINVFVSVCKTNWPVIFNEFLSTFFQTKKKDYFIYFLLFTGYFLLFIYFLIQPVGLEKFHCKRFVFFFFFFRINGHWVTSISFSTSVFSMHVCLCKIEKSLLSVDKISSRKP